MDGQTGRDRKHLRRTLVVAIVVTASLLAPGRAHAADCHGDPGPQMTNLTLTADITDCPDNGIEIGANGITINLNGHTIDGEDDTDGFGILNNGFDNVKIIDTAGGGTIQQFGFGIFFSNANGTQIRDITVTDNNAGASFGTGGGIVFFQSGTTTTDVTKRSIIKRVNVTNNASNGIVFYRSSLDTQILNSDVVDNGGDGIFFGGAGEPVDITNGPQAASTFDITVTEALISGNTVDGNGGTGIAIDATGMNLGDDDGPGGSANVISGNDVTDNGNSITTPVGHDRRGSFEIGGHGVKVAGTLVNTKVLNNTLSRNGTPATALTCGERNGAGALFAGRQKRIAVRGNMIEGNAMAGVLVAGTHSRISIVDNEIASNNVNCEDDEAGILLTGAQQRMRVAENDVHNNAASGIQFHGHSKSLRIMENVVDANIGNGGGGEFDPATLNPDDTAGIVVHGRSLNLQILRNRSTNNANTGQTDEAIPQPLTGHGIDVRGSVRKVGDAKQALLISGNRTLDNEGRGIGVFVQGSEPDDGSDPSETGIDLQVQKANNVRAIGNRANDNGTDGMFIIADVTLANNIANNNADHGIEHESDPTAPPRSADAADGPHIVKDADGNAASGNGTDCSASLSC